MPENRIYDKKAFIFHFTLFCHEAAILSVEVGKYGRIVLPKKLRKKYGVDEGIRLIVTESRGRICLVPIKTYEKPTEALFGSVKTKTSIDEPKKFAREAVRIKLLEEIE